MSAIRPGGALFQLPRDLRDKIYGYCFSRSYIVSWVDDRYLQLADLAILQVSRSISCEAKHVLFSKAASRSITFRYEVDFGLLQKTYVTTPPMEATECMGDIEFDVVIDPGAWNHRRGTRISSERRDRLYAPHIMDPLCEATVNRFTGTSVIRGDFQMRFTIRDHAMWKDHIELMKTRFFQTLKEFKGFRRVTIMLTWHSLYFQSGTKLESGKDFDEMVMELDPHLDDVLVELVPHLGGCAIKVWADSDRNLMFSEVEFHPLEFHVQSLRAEATRLTKEAERLEGQGLQQANRSIF